MRSHLRLASVIGAGTLSLIAAAPALAAAPVAQSDANAITVSVAGNENGSGVVTATNDGSGERKTGDTTPPLSVLQGQDLLNAGVLGQEATASVTDRVGNSAACAGLTGNGGSVVEIGDSRCLRPGAPVGLDVANLDLTGTLVFNPESALGELAATQPLFDAVFSQVTAPLAAAIADTPLGTTGINGTLGVIEGSCVAGNGTASGDANIIDSRLTLDIADQTVVLANLPANPPPNTDVPINLDAATEVILGAVETQLETMLADPDAASGPLAPLAALPQAVQDEVIVTLVEATREQLLTPLSENVINLVLNKQTRTGNDSISVTAFDVSVLPVAREQFDATLVGVQIGNVNCGPSGRVAAAAAPPASETVAPPGLPIGVSAGYESAPGSPGDSSSAVVLGAFAVLGATGAGAVAFRRLRA